MKKLIVTLSAAAFAAGAAFTPLDADAKRLGSGKTTGMQRQSTDAPAQSGTPAQPGAPTQNQGTAPAQNPAAVPGAAATAGATAAAQSKRSWMGPLAGLAAGLGLAALASYLGFGEELATMLMIGLLVMLALAAFGWWKMRKAMSSGAAAGGSFGHMNLAGAGAPAPNQWSQPQTAQPQQPGSSLFRTAFNEQNGGATAAPRQLELPPGFDLASFERTAKLIFLRMQEANDAGQVEELRKFTTPELFASLRLDVMERSGKAQRTEVPELTAQVVDTARENGQSVITVRYHGRVIEDGQSETFDELWHLTQPADGSRDWLIAGIQQRS